MVLGILIEIVKPLINEPALIINQSPTKRLLVIADLHLGIENTLIEKGVQIPSHIQTERLIKKLIGIVEHTKPTSLIILGDLKHSVPTISQMEWMIIPSFFEKLKDIPIHIILGNHESEFQIEGLTTRNIRIHSDQGCMVEVRENHELCKIALFHGHTWPGKELFSADILIMAHNHPIIEFRDELNTRSFEPVWIRAHWDKLKLAKAYLKYLNIKNMKNPLKILQEKYQITINDNTEIIIMPAFNDLLGGIPFNSENSKFIGPLLKSNSIKLDEAEATLLDGIILEKLKEIYLCK